jgi:molybdenum cofactor biosynthesis protein A
LLRSQNFRANLRSQIQIHFEGRMLTDNHGRNINYLRLAVTDRCNLRCTYCMPEAGLKWIPRADLLTFEEIERLLFVFHQLGITKLRFTGGEPFLRKDFPQLLEMIAGKKWFDQLAITTNGTLAANYVPLLKQLGVHSVNLSLDTLDPQRFHEMTRRNDFEEVMRTFHLLMEHEIDTKVNAVIVDGQNDSDILPLAQLSAQHKADVRYIEEMPFNGVGERHAIKWNYRAILGELKIHYPDISKLPDPANSTSLNYHVPGHKGNIGIIPAWSRSFCGTCNRIRLTPKGMMKTCLYDNGKLDLRALVRSGCSDEEMSHQIIHAIGHRAKDGFEEENARKLHPVTESMATIGG